MKNYSFFTLICTLLFSTISFSFCDVDNDNLIMNENCNFASDIAGWTQGAGTSTHEGIDDYRSGALGGSAQMNSADLGGAFAANLNQCLDIPNDGSSQTIGAWFRGVSGLDSTCNVQAQFYAGNICSLANQGMCTASIPVTSGTNWTEASCNTGALAGASSSLRIIVFCSNFTGNFVTRSDNISIVPEGTLPVELKSFSIE